MTRERKEQLETRAWELARAIGAMIEEMNILGAGREPEELDEEVAEDVEKLYDTIQVLSIVKDSWEAEARYGEDDIDDLFGPPPNLSLVEPDDDPFPYMAPNREHPWTDNEAWDDEAAF